MAALVWSTLFLALAALVVKAEYDPDICTLQKLSSGLIPPPLPKNFQGKADSLDYNQKTVRYEEMNFDYSNNLAKYMLVENGIEHHFLFDNKVKQVVEYDILHPGKNFKDDPLSWGCEAKDVEGSEYRDMFGYRDSNMYNSYETLQYGQSHRYAFNGTYRMDQRGLLVDSFIGCVYNQDLEATLRMNYSFTNAAVYTSGGTSVEDVLGIEDGMLSVPTKLDEFGVIYDSTSGQKQLVNISSNIFWFKGEPEFDRNTFKIPVYMYCNNYRGRKQMPDIPDAFSTRVQVTTISRDSLGALANPEVTGYEEVYYYRDKDLARRDFVPDPNVDTDIKNWLGLDPVKSVYDFNTGVLYITSIPTGKCVTTYIPLGDRFDAVGQHMYIELAEPEEIFRIQSNEKQYKGSHFIRDIETDVFAGRYFDEHLNASYIKETYMATNGWHEEADDFLGYAVPIKHVLFPEQLSGELVENITEYHFFKFKATPPRLMDFDVSNCIETIQHKEYAIILTLTNDERNTLYKYKFLFQESAQYYLTEITQVFTPLRIQRVQLRQLSLADVRPTLAFTLVGKATLRTNTPIGQPGASLKDATDNLRKFIDRNQFSLKFVPPKQGREDEPVPIYAKAFRGDLYERTAGGLQAPESDDYDEEVLPTLQYADEEEEEGEKKGMSPGSLGLLAVAMLFIGIGIGIAVMYLYLRQKADKSQEDRIVLQVSKAPDA
ncbi:hypothetical protein HNY73_014379 [Argiope bruennichi]|uniref:LolA-like domain-containing protein n=1 Tax=Argiope bruennichi TaxID=94029 RepID=A0A8T0EPX1_ARGBR|nr:hypothetical protein HNY73_014379 [Argiope bruennichi]